MRWLAVPAHGWATFTVLNAQAKRLPMFIEVRQQNRLTAFGGRLTMSGHTYITPDKPMTQLLDHASPLPLYAQAEQALRALIQRDEFQAGQLIPKETDLAMRLGVSRHTMRIAMDKLVREGLLLRKKGVGTQVNTSPIQTKLSEWTSFSREMGQQGRELETLEKEVQQVPADAAVAQAFGIPVGTPVMSLVRLKGQDGQPVVVFRSWFHPRLSIPADEPFDGPLYDLLERQYHAVPAISEEEIGALGADAPDRARLDMDDTVPMLYRKRWVTDAAGRPIEFCLAHYRADRFVYAIRITRDGIAQ